jgi:hypothetical protein
MRLLDFIDTAGVHPTIDAVIDGEIVPVRITDDFEEFLDTITADIYRESDDTPEEDSNEGRDPGDENDNG